MEIIKFATDWAKAEVFSARFFILFGLLFLAASYGFRQLGKTEMAKAYIVPSLVAGLLILAVGVGIFFANKSRISSFKEAYKNNPTEFVETELERTEKIMGEYRNIVFKIIPSIIVVAALTIVFVDKPLWRAAAITTIAMMLVILLVDSNANARVINYHKQLMLEKEH